MRKLLLPILLVIALCAFIGCKATLDPSGAYAPVGTNVVAQTVALGFYNTDASYDLAYNTVLAAFQFEMDNAAMLWKVSPNIKHTLDQIRPKSWDANVRYLTARAAYLASPTPGGLTSMQTLLAEMQALSQAALAALPKEGAVK